MAVRRVASARGRHFLRSKALAESLVHAVRPGELVLDLGAGEGILSAALLGAGARVWAVELDPALAVRLRDRFGGSARVVEADATTFALPREPFAVVANLPFAHGTEILRRLLDPAAPLRCAELVVQWELAAKRAAAWPTTLLSAWWGAWHELAVVRRLPRTVFAPPPSVDAAVLRAVRRAEPLVEPHHASAYEAFLRAAYDARTLRGTLPPRTLRRLAHEHGFDPRGLPQDLDAPRWAALYAASRRRG